MQKDKFLYFGEWELVFNKGYKQETGISCLL